MRQVTDSERKKRGCSFCADMVLVESGIKKKYKRRTCPFAECPHHELDEYKTYGAFLKSKGSITMTAILRELGLGEL